MNFSDATVQKVACEYLRHAQNVNPKATVDFSAIEAALSSLTLADLMQVDEVRELVDEAAYAKDFLQAANIGTTAEDCAEGLESALTPFTQAKEK